MTVYQTHLRTAAKHWWIKVKAPNAMVWHPAVVQWSLILIMTTCSPPSNMYLYGFRLLAKVVPTPLLGAAEYSFQASIFRVNFLGFLYIPSIFVLNVWGALKSMKWCKTSLPVFLGCTDQSFFETTSVDTPKHHWHGPILSKYHKVSIKTWRILAIMCLCDIIYTCMYV